MSNSKTIAEWAVFGLILTPAAVYWAAGFEAAVIYGLVLVGYLQVNDLFKVRK